MTICPAIAATKACSNWMLPRAATGHCADGVDYTKSGYQNLASSRQLGVDGGATGVYGWRMPTRAADAPAWRLHSSLVSCSKAAGVSATRHAVASVISRNARKTWIA